MSDIVSHAANKNYRDNFDRVFKGKTHDLDIEVDTLTEEELAEFNKGEWYDKCRTCEMHYDVCTCERFTPTYVWVVFDPENAEIIGVHGEKPKAHPLFEVTKLEVEP